MEGTFLFHSLRFVSLVFVFRFEFFFIVFFHNHYRFPLYLFNDDICCIIFVHFDKPRSNNEIILRISIIFTTPILFIYLFSVSFFPCALLHYYPLPHPPPLYPVSMPPSSHHAHIPSCLYNSLHHIQHTLNNNYICTM